MKSEWMKLSDDEQEQYYEEHNIGGGFRDMMGGTRVMKDSELPPEIKKWVQEERRKLLKEGKITKEKFDELNNQ